MKKQIIHSTAALSYPAIDCACGENPPAASVVMAWQRLS